MKTINVSLIKKVDDSYPIHVQEGLLDNIPVILKDFVQKEKILIVTDSNVSSLYGNKLYQSLKDSDFDVYQFAFPAGEEQKNIETKISIETFMFENHFTRDSLILALGGGVVGDIAGFTASTFNRGIAFIQIPSSIVAQVDSSIGGKTAIDVPSGKNLIGTFYQPKMVLIDPLVLTTLPEKEYNSGMAEVIKHAVISDKQHFSFLKKNIDNIKKREMSTLTSIIIANCDIKRNVVELDEREGNLRKILNFGHTIGHAVEKIMNYTMSHGECVALGMVVEAEISEIMGQFDLSARQEMTELIKCFSLPVSIPGGISAQSIYEATLLDKKTINSEPNYSLPLNIGKMLQINGSYGIPVKKSVVFQAIANNQTKS